MSLTDAQIYAAHPDIKAMNDQYVALGSTLKDLEPKLIAAHEAVQAAENTYRTCREAAQLDLQKAQAALAGVEAAGKSLVNSATRTLSMLRDEVIATQQKQTTIQRHHNDAIADVQSAEAAKPAPTEHPTE